MLGSRFVHPGRNGQRGGIGCSISQWRLPHYRRAGLPHGTQNTTRYMRNESGECIFARKPLHIHKMHMTPLLPPNQPNGPRQPPPSLPKSPAAAAQGGRPARLGARARVRRTGFEPACVCVSLVWFICLPHTSRSRTAASHPGAISTPAPEMSCVPPHRRLTTRVSRRRLYPNRPPRQLKAVGLHAWARAPGLGNPAPDRTNLTAPATSLRFQPPARKRPPKRALWSPTHPPHANRSPISALRQPSLTVRVHLRLRPIRQHFPTTPPAQPPGGTRG